MSSFYSNEELTKLGLGKFGNNVLVSKKASLYMLDKISIGDNVRIDDFCVVSAGGGIEIDSYVHISAFVCLFGGTGIKIGRNCSISSFTSVYSESDDFSGESLVNPFFSKNFKPGYKTGKVVLQNFCNIGVHCCIMPGVTLKEGTVIGANSLVMKDCEPWSVYFGSPAKKIKERSKKILELEKAFLARNHEIA